MHLGSYFNISGQQTIAGTKSQLCSRRYLTVDQTGISVGTINEFPVDVTKEFELQKDTPTIDNCFLLISTTDPSKAVLDTRPQALQWLGFFHHPESGIHVQVFSTEPVFQFYTGDHLDVSVSPSYGPRTGFCVEPGRFIKVVNQP